MTFTVPQVIAVYLAAEAAKDADAISRCFAQDGAVRDEGLDYRGRDAIRQWNQSRRGLSVSESASESTLSPAWEEVTERWEA